MQMIKNKVLKVNGVRKQLNDACVRICVLVTGKQRINKKKKKHFDRGNRTIVHDI